MDKPKFPALIKNLISIKLPSFSRKHTVVFIFLLAFAVRLIIGFIGYNNEVWKGFADDLARERYATKIIEKGLVFDITDFKSPESIFAPGIPLVIALGKLLFGNTWLPIFFVNAFIGAITCLIIFKIGLHFFDQQVALLSFIWAAYYPSFIRYTSTAGNEPWIVFLFALTVLVSIKAIQSNRINLYTILYAFCFILLAHVDERYVTYSLLFAMFLFLGKVDYMLKFKKVLLFIAFSIVFSLPWLIRNYLVYDDIVVISCRTTSITNPIFKHRPELMFFDHTPNSLYLDSSQIDSVQKGLLTKFSTGKAISEGQIKAMKEGNVPHTFSQYERIISRLYYLWMPYKFKDNYRIDGYNFKQAWSFEHNLISILSYGLLLPFAILSIVLLFHQKRWRVMIIFVSILLYHTLLHVVFIPYTRDRYRHPVDFVIIILGCYGLWICYSFIKSKYYYLISKDGK